MKKKDFMVIIVIVVIATALYFGVRLFTSKDTNGEYADVYHGNTVILTFNINENKIYEFDGSYGHMKLEVKDGKWRVFDEDCPNHNCSQMGWVSKNDLIPIICLPNEIVVEFVGEK